MQLREAQLARAKAMLKLDDGDLPEARRELDSLIDGLTASGYQADPELARAYIDRATVGRFANDWDGALSDVNAAKLIADRLPVIVQQSLLTPIYLIQAKIYSTSFSKAFDLVRAQSALDQLADFCRDDWIAQELESHIAFQMCDWDRAASKALQAASTLETTGWRRSVAACRRRAGEALLELGRFDEATQQLLAALAFFDAHGPSDLLSETRLAVARLASKRLNHDQAWALAQQVLDEVESRVRRFVDVAEQQRFLLDKLRFYEQAFDIGLARGTTVGWLRAWSVAERSKSFYLAHLLANADVPLFDGVDPEIVRAIEALEKEQDSCERKLGTLDAPQRGGPGELELESKLRSLSDERNAKLQSVMKTNFRWASLRNPSAFDAADLMRSLPVEIIPVSFYWRVSSGGAILHVFARDAFGSPVHNEVEWTSEELDELARAGERLRGPVDDYAELLPEGVLDRILSPELRKKLPNDGCLLLSVHGRLRGVPVHALPLDNSILIDHWSVQYVPSLGLPASQKTNAPEVSVLLMGSVRNGWNDPPLKDVESELNEIQQLWSDAKRRVVAKIISPDASPEDAGWPPQKWSEFGVLHFACHGRFDEERPLDSGLRLGSHTVRGSELFATKLNASVVALSACSLGQRATRCGNTEVVSEEWIGLYLPLFYAGARSLVVSLWDANSQVAQQFMVEFHKMLAQQEKPHVAFRAALLRVSGRLQPRWANWCLVGLP
jgi:CHAT domain-containing protein/tetratricopeptide (TPR) repeat protein